MADKIFVTGATGMLGANLVRRLIKKGDNITILIRKGSSHPLLKGLKIKKAYGDIMDIKSITKGMKGCDYVYHMAGYISYNKSQHKKMYDVNVIGTRNVMAVALENDIKKCVHTSSTAAIGIAEDPDNVLDETYKFNGTFKSIGYMHSKKLAENEALEAHKKGLNVVIVNPSTIIGTGDEKMNSGVLFKNILSNKIKAAPPGGNSVVSVSDVVEGHILAMKKGKSGERYILNAENIKFLEMFNVIAEKSGAKKIKRCLPKYLYFPLISIAWASERLNKNAKLTPQVLFFSFKHRYFDSKKAKHKLGWIPKQNFQDAVTDAVKYYKGRGLI